MKFTNVIALSLVFSTLAFGGTRREAIRAAGRLSQVASDLSREARYKGYPNTARGLADIANLADDTEREARRGTRAGTEDLVNDIIDTYIGTRQFIGNIPYIGDRLRIKRQIRNAINNLGQAVFGSNFITVRFSLAPGQVLSEAQQEQQLDSIQRSNGTGQDWDSDSDNGGASGGGGVDDGGFDN